MAEAAIAVTAEAAVVIAPAQPLERQSSAQAAASKPRFLLNLEAIARYSAATASRHKKVARAGVADVVAAATIVADAAAAAATNSLA